MGSWAIGSLGRGVGLAQGEEKAGNIVASLRYEAQCAGYVSRGVRCVAVCRLR